VDSDRLMASLLVVHPHMIHIVSQILMQVQGGILFSLKLLISLRFYKALYRSGRCQNSTCSCF
jgi:hypothetical protein